MKKLKGMGENEKEFKLLWNYASSEVEIDDLCNESSHTKIIMPDKVR